jgi:amino-acid N-acetyltransferase
MEFLVRKARVSDVTGIYDLLRKFAEEELLLPRSFSNLYEMLQTFYVAEAYPESGKLLGIGALQVAWEDLAEVRSLAVTSDARGMGLGKAITLEVEKDAYLLGIKKMFALTYVPEFFTKLGYKIVSLDTLPQKVWAVCFNCVHYPNCKEIAVVKELNGEDYKF